MAEVAFAGLSVRYGERTVLGGVSARIAPGERCAVVGPNGSGKTTLLRALAGIVEPAAGGVEVAGRPLGGLSRREAARLSAFLPQEEHWEFPFTVEEVVRCGRFAHATGLYREAPGDRRAVADALEATGMDALRGRPITELSGGERRRAVLARVLAQQAPVLLLDEPTTALDLEHRSAVLRALRDLRATVVMATHDLDAAARCGRVLLLAAGRIVADGTPEEVLAEQRLRDVFRVAVRVVRDGGRIHVVAEI
ncbi:MAG: ABC transporter ATP-binding protein [Planctomycetota bacterium]